MATATMGDAEYQYEANTTITSQFAIHELAHSFKSVTIHNG